MALQHDRPLLKQEMGRSPQGSDMGTSYAIRRRGLQAEIQQVVKRYIIDHQFRPGDPLPGEGELARQLGISRPSLREAMKVLQTIGAIETRHGSGTYVGSLSLDALADGLGFQVRLAAQHADSAPAELLDLIDLREGIESRMIGRVTGRHTAQQIGRMRSLNEQIATTSDRSEEFGDLDLELHLLFYEPLGSRVKNEFVRMFWQVSNFALDQYASSARRTAVAEHGAIIDALADADRDAAVAAMSTHLCRVAESIERAYEPQRANGRSGSGPIPLNGRYAD
jgi:DNA-binding FadR family transcriptional regulator